MKIIKEMFEASVDGATYDENRWGQYYKPSGIGNNNSDADDVPAAKPTVAYSRPAPVQEDAPFDVDDTPVASAPVSTAPKSSGDSNQRAAEILSMIRNRKTAE